jgi:acetoin utilization deacetylase AcuC-like enzyme
MLKVAYHSLYHHPLPENHRFPMEKYTLLPEQLMYEGTLNASHFFQPEKASLNDIRLTHDLAYLEKLIALQLSASEIRRTGFPLSNQLVEREMVIMGGSIQAAYHALQFGISMNIAGGTHHAFFDRGEGFCLLNDHAITANVLLREKLATRILIVDLDVHQGNGTAALFKENDAVFTFSMHGEKNYPMQKEQSDLDIPLKDGITDEAYLNLLDKHLKTVIEEFEPDFILYQSGVDVLKTDKIGRLGLSIEGCKLRDKLVIDCAFKNQIPLSASMGGGYSERIADIIEAHANTFRLAQEIYF